MQATPRRMASVPSSWQSALGRLRWATGAGLTVGILCLATGLLWPKRYSSTAILRFAPFGFPAYGNPQVPPHFDAWRKNALTLNFLESLRDRYSLFSGLPSSQRDARVRQSIRFELKASKGPIGEPRYVVEISFTADTPRTAQQVVRDLVGQTLESNYAYNYAHFPHCVHQCRGDCNCASRFEIRDVPSIPSTPDAPNMKHFLELGSGLALAVVVVVLLI